MSHEIEANYHEDWENLEKQCCNCTSFREADCYCSEAKAPVSPTGHCDFFQARD